MQSIYWHDYETFGTNPQKDRAAQFAGVRTDLDLNIIEDSLTIYCAPSEDSLPSPQACLITGITPQIARQKGVSEAQFTKLIHEVFSVSGSCIAGYNNIRFDDEFTRNLLYRNFYDPYEHEWKNGNSKWDIIDVVRLTYALRPEGINWPKGDDGEPIFRLELLCEANGIEHTSAHDAMSDVYATISLAKLIKTKQPKLYDYVFANRDKRLLSDFLDSHILKPVFHVSSKFPAALGCSALVVPLFRHPTNKNGFIVFDLRQDPRILVDLTLNELSTRLYTAASNLNKGEVRPALKTVHVNKCPMLVPASMIKTIPQRRLDSWQLDLSKIQEHLDWFKSHPEFIIKLKGLFEIPSKLTPTFDPDLMIYTGGFFSAPDKMMMERVRSSSEEELMEGEFQFQDKRLPEMLFRYKARNFPGTLSEKEHRHWQNHCAEKLLSTDSTYFSLRQFFESLEDCSMKDPQSKRTQEIIEELKCHAESITPYAD